MKAIERPKAFSHARTSLETVIPLATPFSLEIDISSLCNLDCNYCFRYNNKEIKDMKINFSNMSWEQYKKIIDDVADFPEKPKKFHLEYTVNR